MHSFYLVYDYAGGWLEFHFIVHPLPGSRYFIGVALIKIKVYSIFRYYMDVNNFFSTCIETKYIIIIIVIIII